MSLTGVGKPDLWWHDSRGRVQLRSLFGASHVTCPSRRPGFSGPMKQTNTNTTTTATSSTIVVLVTTYYSPPLHCRRCTLFAFFRTLIYCSSLIYLTERGKSGSAAEVTKLALWALRSPFITSFDQFPRGLHEAGQGSSSTTSSSILTRAYSPVTSH